MHSHLREKNNVKFLVIKGYQNDFTYVRLLKTIDAFGLDVEKPITVKMVLKRGDLFTNDYIKITKK